MGALARLYAGLQTVDKVERQRSTVNFFAKGQESQKQETKKKIKGKAV